jgi:predicted enzyme related to lactoylglutathione lyase
MSFSVSILRSSGRRKSTQANNIRRSTIMGNKIIHVEVVGKDGPALQQFYSDVFGWDLDTNNPGGYGMLRQDDLTAGFGPSQDGGAGHVTFYIGTDDAQATLDKVTAAGGRVLMPPTEVAPVSTIALFADPEGHVIGLM